MQLRQVEDHIVGVGVLEAMRTLQTSFCPFGGGRISESRAARSVAIRCDCRPRLHLRFLHFPAAGSPRTRELS